jgi:hypothetical protein
MQGCDIFVHFEHCSDIALYATTKFTGSRILKASLLARKVRKSQKAFEKEISLDFAPKTSHKNDEPLSG